MSSLRESKKQATRQAMSDAAARIVVEEGAEALTVARIANAAQVSPRTFHNYFSSVTEALLHFASDVIADVATQVPTYPAEMTIAAIMEDITLAMFTDDGVELRSVTSLFRIGEVLETMDVSCDETRSFNERCLPLAQAFMQRHPDWSAFEVTVMLNACGAAGLLALRHIADNAISATEEKRATVRTAFKALTFLR